MTEESKPTPYVDDITVKDLYVETVQVLALPGGAIRIEFCVNHWTPHLPLQVDRTTPAARIAMHPGLAITLRDLLTKNMEAAQQQNALSQAPAASQAKN